MAFNTSTLPSYVDQNRLPLLANAVLKSKSASLFNLQTDVKTSAAITLINATPVFQEGGCGWNAQGDVRLTQRIIETGLVKINMEFCDKDLMKSWLQFDVKAGLSNDALPFEEYFVNGIVEKVKEGVEKAIWQGDTLSSDATLKHTDGLLKILNSAAGVIKPTVAESGAYEAIKTVYMAIPEAVLDKAVILVGADTFRTFVQELVEKNFYHYSGNAEVAEIMLPGTNTKIIAVNGLNGTGKVIASALDNLYYGCDMMNDAETFDIWYSKDFQAHRFAMSFNFGVQVAFPDEVVMGAVKA